jgi:hypothetical protein
MSAYTTIGARSNSAPAASAHPHVEPAEVVAQTTDSPRPRFAQQPGWIERVPQVLKDHPRWVLWKFVRRLKADGTVKWTKMPLQARDPAAPAGTTDPTTWASFEKALAALDANAGRIDGLGFVLGWTAGPDPCTISGIDLDDCVDDQGQIADWARIRLEDFASYAEISPSGRGVKIFVLGCWANGATYEALDGLGDDGKGQIEIARRDRFFTVTGDRVDDRWTDLAPGSILLEGLHGYIERENLGRKGPSVCAGRSPHDVGKPLPREELAGLSPLEKFLTQLEAMRNRVTPCGDGYTACCPVHRESNPSMTFRVEDSCLLVFCHGCEAGFEKIMAAAGLLPRDAFPDSEPDEVAASIRPRIVGSRFPHVQVEAPPELIEAMTAKAEWYQQQLLERPDELTELASRLEVEEDTLQRLGVGWKEKNRRTDVRGTWIDDGPAWTFPEVDGEGRIIGIQRRYEDESLDKRTISGSMRGIYVPVGWQEIQGPVYIPEGASDVAALIGVGLCAIGRPSAKGGVGHLARLLRGADRRIVVLGEHDRKADGRWPGKEGVDRVADALGRELGRRVDKGYPPEGYKDVRDWIASRRII